MAVEGLDTTMSREGHHLLDNLRHDGRMRRFAPYPKGDIVRVSPWKISGGKKLDPSSERTQILRAVPRSKGALRLPVIDPAAYDTAVIERI